MSASSLRQLPQDFADALASGRFLVTTEEPPPKGAALSRFRARVEPLAGVVDAINLTESSAAVMTMSPIGVVPALLQLGLHPILQMTCRDRNRIALQADLLAAAALGVRSVACMSGDPIDGGDHPDATPVFDLDALSLIRATQMLSNGRDLSGALLHGPPSFCCGAVANPAAADLEHEVARMQAKVEAGVSFFQTQTVYEPRNFERFMARTSGIGVPVLATFIVPKSPAMARRMNATIPGVDVPESVIRALDHAEDPIAAAVALSGQIVSQLRPMCRGVHLIAVGWEQRLPQILAAAGIERP
ncbi:MAG TPA: methylenetetrahydrofolate reductase [Dehalococcoidia bacterium]|nr:methylenetetrahydrofolate reductase [Dehalococcoidia bacterium]